MEAAFGEDKSGDVSVADEYEGGRPEVIEVDDL
jgi:hypothetical protein